MSRVGSSTQSPVTEALKKRLKTGPALVTTELPATPRHAQRQEIGRDGRPGEVGLLQTATAAMTVTPDGVGLASAWPKPASDSIASSSARPRTRPPVIAII